MSRGAPGVQSAGLQKAGPGGHCARRGELPLDLAADGEGGGAAGAGVG